MRHWRDEFSTTIRKLEQANGNGMAVAGEARQLTVTLRSYEQRACKLALRGWDSERGSALLSAIESRGFGVGSGRRAPVPPRKG
jgi:hypothetical protein